MIYGRQRHARHASGSRTFQHLTGRVAVSFRASGYLLSGVALIIQRAFPLKCGMQPLRVVEIIDVGCDSLLDFLTAHPGLLSQEFSFQANLTTFGSRRTVSPFLTAPSPPVVEGSHGVISHSHAITLYDPL